MFSVLEGSKLFRLSGSLQKTAIDNNVCFLYYRVTVSVMATASILLGATQFYGDPIKCDTDGVKPDLMDNYCWITGTWTIKELMREDILEEVVAPGIGLFDPLVHSRTFHRYYQWVPLVLAINACRFYLPRLIWKIREGGRIAAITREMKHHDPDTPEHCRFVARSLNILKQNDNNVYALTFMFCEMLNPLNVLLELWLTNSILGGGFSDFGDRWLSWSRRLSSLNSDHLVLSPLYELFPKITQCSYKKHGPSGDIQTIHGMCLLSLNILNEKIFLILWFWYFVLLTLSAVQIVFRMANCCIPYIRRRFLAGRCRRELFPDVSFVSSNLSLGNAFILQQISKNVSRACFDDLVMQLAMATKAPRTEKLLVSCGLLYQAPHGRYNFFWKFLDDDDAQKLKLEPLIRKLVREETTWKQEETLKCRKRTNEA